jgi:hypothetical protein
MQDFILNLLFATEIKLENHLEKGKAAGPAAQRVTRPCTRQGGPPQPKAGKPARAQIAKETLLFYAIAQPLNLRFLQSATLQASPPMFTSLPRRDPWDPCAHRRGDQQHKRSRQAT